MDFRINKCLGKGNWNIWEKNRGLIASLANGELRLHVLDQKAISDFLVAINNISKAIDAAQQTIERCPFCGAEARVVPNEEIIGPQTTYRVECLGGLLPGDESHALDRWHDTTLEAILAWNKRIR